MPNGPCGNSPRTRKPWPPNGCVPPGTRTRFTDGRGNTTRYTTNAWGLPESTVEPATTAHPAAADRTWTTTYDTDANPVVLSAPGGVRNSRTFDLLGRLTNETGTGAETPTAERVFDHDPLGRLITSGTPSGANSFTYNDRGALLTTTGPAGDTTFGYDQDGNLTSRTDASGTATYGYTNARLSTIQDGITATTQTLGYDDSGRMTAVTYGAGRTRTLAYDDLGRITDDTLTGPTDTEVASITYGYDLDDRLTTKNTAGLADAGTNTYDYDHADRLTNWTHDPTGNEAPTTIGYGWDKAGNRTAADNTTAQYDERNRLLTDGTSAYSYTPRGTVASKTTDTDTESFTFDAFDRLTSQGTTNYTYDALDRIATRNGQTFTYTGASNELATDGTTTFSRGPTGQLLALHTGGDTRLTISDQHGDVIAGFDPTTPLNQVADSTSYDPFGTPTATTGQQRPIGYQGDYTDPDTGQVNMTARWYNPSNGTFTSRDSITLPASPSGLANRYGYGLGSPTNYTDPTGHAPGSIYCVPGELPYNTPLCYNYQPGGAAGSGIDLPPPPSGGGGAGCGGGLPPEAKAMGCCTSVLAFASCAGRAGNVGLHGDWTGSGGGSFTTGGGSNGRGGGAGGRAPRPDPAIAARKATETPPSTTPHPSRTPCSSRCTADRQAHPYPPTPTYPPAAHPTTATPSMTSTKATNDSKNPSPPTPKPLLGQVKNTTAAPSELVQTNYPSQSPPSTTPAYPIPIPDDVNAMGAKQRKTWLRQHYDRLRDAPDMTDQALQFRAAYCAEYNDESVCSSLPVSVRGATLGELFAIGSLFFPWARAVRGVGALVGKLVGRGAGSGRATVDAGKFDYLFGKVASNSHNAARSLQNHRQLARIGVHNTPKGRELLRRHFDDIVARKDNIIDTIDNDYGKFQIRESLFVGPRGLLKFESTRQVTESGLRLTTVIPMGGL